MVWFSYFFCVVHPLGLRSTLGRAHSAGKSAARIHAGTQFAPVDATIVGRRYLRIGPYGSQRCGVNPVMLSRALWHTRSREPTARSRVAQVKKMLKVLFDIDGAGRMASILE